LIRLLIVLLLTTALLHAQQAGSQDLTRVLPQPGAGENVFPNCPHGRVANTDGLMISKMRDKFALSIEDLSSRLIPIGSEFSATVRLKNTSDHSVTIPWLPNFQDVIAGQPQDDWQFESATFSFRIETGVEYKRTTELEGETVLYGSDDKPTTLLELAPGQWATLRVRAVTRCRYKSQDPAACPGLRPDSKARLTAEWSENGISVQNSNCYIQRGNFAGPRGDSHPEIVTLSKQ
jgi:hypothetical protein